MFTNSNNIKMNLEHKLEENSLNTWFEEVRELFLYYSNNINLLNLNNYEELSRNYKAAIQKADVEYIKHILYI